MKTGMKVKGAKQFGASVEAKARPADVRGAVRANAAALEADMKNRANFVKGYETGETKRSITTEMRDGNFTAVVMPKTEHAPALINGTRHMAAQDFLRPALYAQRDGFVKDITKLLDK